MICYLKMLGKHATFGRSVHPGSCQTDVQKDLSGGPKLTQFHMCVNLVDLLNPIV